jgi:hypothetical protein
MPTQTRKTPLCYGDKIGDVHLIGMYHGAICWREMLVEIEGDCGIWVRVVAKSVQNEDGTFSTVYEQQS